MFSFFKNKKETPEEKKPQPYQPRAGSKNLSLEDIDTSYWKTEDKEWMEARKAKWQEIEPMLISFKTSKGKNIIKAYFLRGKMPNWQALSSWDEYQGHVDVFTFLWLHPSWDETLLKELRDLYINSDLIIKRDLEGIGLFLSSTTMGPLTDSMDPNISSLYPYVEGHTEMLFRVLIGDPMQTCYPVVNLDYAQKYGREYKLPTQDFQEKMLMRLSSMGQWLCNEMTCPINQDFLYQFDQPLEWWYQNSFDDNYLFMKARSRLPSLERALCRIHSFDTEKEGDTCRNRFVRKIIKIFNEREFPPQFKKMWEDVKSGKIAIDNPCEDPDPDWWTEEYEAEAAAEEERNQY